MKNNKYSIDRVTPVKEGDVCPECGSSDVYTELGMLFLFTNYCRKCGYKEYGTD